MSGISRHGSLTTALRGLVLFALGFTAIQGMDAPALAQEGSAKSPAAHLDMSRPQFDTTTRVFEIGGILEKNAGTIVAEVDGRPITLGEVGDAIRGLPPYLNSQPFDVLYPSIIAHLTQQHAIVLRAQRQELEADPVVRRRMNAAANGVLAGEWLQRETNASVTETAMLARYNQKYAGNPGPDEVRLRLILVPTEEHAIALIKELQAGADFGAVARRVSKDGTASRGGDLGYMPRAYLNAEIGTAAFLLRPGQMSEYPISSNGQWYIVKVEDRRHGATPTFPSIREYLSVTMQQERVEAVAKAAQDGVMVRENTILGKETEASAKQ